jgi:hypothetical protein
LQLRKILDSLPKTTFTIGTFLALKQIRISDVALEKSISLRALSTVKLGLALGQERPNQT